MSGIAGLIDGAQPRVDLDLRTMLDAIVHRGPDGEGLFVDGGVALGMRRLSVIDVAHGWQPLAARGGRVLAFQNGEIYNHGELRSALAREGARFATASDTEVLAHGYERWGIEGLLPRIDGMYAIAILDRDARMLHIARDRFGEKPLFYASAQGRFAFASDAGVLAALPWVDADLDPLSLRRYFALQYVPGSATIYRRVSRVLPGERIEIALDAPIPKHVRYYVPPLMSAHAIDDDTLAAIVERAVSSRLVADVPVGVLLSGGLASSIVAAIAAVHKPGIATFSIGLRDPDHDESRYAQELASTIGSAHHRLVLEDTSLTSLVPTVAASLDEPLGDAALLPMFALAREARRDATVVLSGDGADEAFAGHGHYRPFTPKDGIAAAMRRALGGSAARDSGTSLIDRLRAETPSGFALMTDTATRARLVPGDARATDTWERDLLAWLSASHEPLQRASAVDLATWLPDDVLAKLDRTTMAASVEGRAPFVASELVEAALALPPAQRMRGADGKIALRRIAARWLPEGIASRRKQALVLPIRASIAHWFDAHGGAAAYFAERALPHVDAAELARIATGDFAAGTPRERLLFASIMLCEWHASQKARVAAMRDHYARSLAQSATTIAP